MTHVFHTIKTHNEHRGYKIYPGNNVVKINTQAATSVTANEKNFYGEGVIINVQLCGQAGLG